MANLRKPVSQKSMTTSIDGLFKRKAERRHQLAALPFEKKIEIVKQLREFGRATKPFRTLYRLQKKAAGTR